MLGLRLDEPLVLGPVAAAVDEAGLERMRRLGLATVTQRGASGRSISLTRRGRLLGGGVTAELLA